MCVEPHGRAALRNTASRLSPASRRKQTPAYLINIQIYPKTAHNNVALPLVSHTLHGIFKTCKKR